MKKKTAALPPVEAILSDHFMPMPDQKTRFVAIYQGTPTNTLGRISHRGLRPEVNINDRATITKDRLTLFIDRYSELTSTLKNSTVKLLQAGVLHITTSNSYRKTTEETVIHVAEFTLDEYMRLRGLKDRKEARRQVQADLEILYSLSMGWMENTGMGEKSFDMTRVCYRAALSRSGIITMAFSPELANYLVNAYEMKLPELYWRINDKRNPNSSPLLWKISLHKKQNRGRPSEDIISVKVLLENAPDIPSYEEVQSTDRAHTRRIIEPLARDLDALSDVLSWEFCNARKAPLTPEQSQGMSYITFISLYVKFTWKQYPQLAPRVKRVGAGTRKK